MAAAAAVFTVQKQRQAREEGLEGERNDQELVFGTRQLSRLALRRPSKNTALVKEGSAPSWFPYQQTTTQEEYDAIVRLQAIWRGYRSRKYSKRVFQRKVMVSELAIRDVLHSLERLHFGWKQLCYHLFFLSFLCVMIFLQLFVYEPSPYGLEVSLRRTANQIYFGDNGLSFDGVLDTNDVFDFIRATVNELYAPDPFEQNNVSACAFDKCTLEVNTSKILRDCGQPTELSGVYNSQNRQQIGLILVQQRYSREPCKTGDLFIDTGMIAEPEYEEIACIGNEQSVEFETLGHSFQKNFTIFGFHPFEITPPARNFLAVLEIGAFNLGKEVSNCAIDQLQEQGWIDTATKSLCMYFIVLNRNGVGRYGYFEICFSFDIGGLISHTLRVQSASLTPRSEQVGAITVTSIFLLLVTINVALLFRKIWRVVGHGLDIGFCNKILPKPKQRPRAKYGSWFFELVVIVLELVVCSKYFQYVKASDEFAPFDNFTLSPTVAVKGVLEIDAAINLQTEIRVLYSVLLVAMVFQSILLLDFHSDTAIISKTLHNAAHDLFAFCLVFVLIVSLYALVGIVMFSSLGESFSKFSYAVQSLLFASMSDFSGLDPLLDIDGEIPPFLVGIYVWTYIFLTTLVLFNVLLSIVVESYLRFQEEKRSKRTMPFFQTLLLSIFIVWSDLRRFYWKKLTCCCRKKKRARLEDGNTRNGGNSNKSLVENDESDSTPFQGLCDDDELRFFGRFLHLRSSDKKDGTYIPTFELRKYLASDLPSGIVERILWLLRERTAEFMPPQAQNDVNMFFRENEEQLYIIDLSREILNRIDKLESRKRAKPAATVDDADDRVYANHEASSQEINE